MAFTSDNCDYIPWENLRRHLKNFFHLIQNNFHHPNWMISHIIHSTHFDILSGFSLNEEKFHLSLVSLERGNFIAAGLKRNFFPLSADKFCFAMMKKVAINLKICLLHTWNSNYSLSFPSPFLCGCEYMRLISLEMNFLYIAGEEKGENSDAKFTFENGKKIICVNMCERVEIDSLKFCGILERIIS